MLERPLLPGVSRWQECRRQRHSVIYNKMKIGRHRTLRPRSGPWSRCVGAWKRRDRWVLCCMRHAESDGNRRDSFRIAVTSSEDHPTHPSFRARLAGGGQRSETAVAQTTCGVRPVVRRGGRERKHSKTGIRIACVANGRVSLAASHKTRNPWSPGRVERRPSLDYSAACPAPARCMSTDSQTDHLAKLAVFFAAHNCSHLYLDVDTNISVQIRKLFEPLKYPGSPRLQVPCVHIPASNESRRFLRCSCCLCNKLARH